MRISDGDRDAQPPDRREQVVGPVDLVDLAGPESPTTMAGRYTRHGTLASSRTIRSASNFVRWYGDGRCWPSSNMSSVNGPS